MAHRPPRKGKPPSAGKPSERTDAAHPQAFIRLAAVAHAAYLQGKQERSPGREIAVVAELLRQK